MSKRKLTRQQIRFLKEIFKNNESLREANRYERWGTLDGVLKQVEDGSQIVYYMMPITDEYDGRPFSEVHSKDKVIIYKYNTLVVKQEMGILERVKSFFNRPKRPGSSKPLQNNELIEKSLDYMRGTQSFFIAPNTSFIFNSFAGEIQYIQNKDATYFKGKNDEWIKYPDMETITTEELKDETTNS